MASQHTSKGLTDVFRYLSIILKLTCPKHISFLLLLSFVFVFLEPHPRHMEVPRLGVELELSRLLMPQPHQHGIRAMSVTYTTARGNAGSLTY